MTVASLPILSDDEMVERLRAMRASWEATSGAVDHYHAYYCELYGAEHPFARVWDEADEEPFVPPEGPHQACYYRPPPHEFVQGPRERTGALPPRIAPPRIGDDWWRERMRHDEGLDDRVPGIVDGARDPDMDAELCEVDPASVPEPPSIHPEGVRSWAWLPWWHVARDGHPTRARRSCPSDASACDQRWALLGTYEGSAARARGYYVRGHASNRLYRIGGGNAALLFPHLLVGEWCVVTLYGHAETGPYYVLEHLRHPRKVTHDGT